MKGPWSVPDNPSSTSDDRENEVVIHSDLAENTIAKSMASLKASLGITDDPDYDGFNWYPVL